MKTAKLVVFILLLLALVGMIGLRILVPPTDWSAYDLQPTPISQVVAMEPIPVAVTPTMAPTPEPTPEPTPTPTPEPTPQLFTISVIGDQTLASAPQFRESPVGYAARMNGDYRYPFSNTAEYFKNDDFTISNLECTLTDKNLYSAQQFSFRSPSAYAQILTEGGVDFVTTANNHMLDFGQEGLNDSWAALEAYGIPYGKEDEAQLFTTESGLTVGIYCAYSTLKSDPDRAVAAVKQLREDGAEYVICAFHWGKELVYTPFDSQTELAHRCIDAGADLIYGSHSHCLQPVEQYGSGLILYSMGNWVFGGSTAPTDMDTAIIQVHVKRAGDGSVSTSGYTVIPCCVSSRPVKDGYSGDNYNDYRPTPYTEGSEAWQRTLDKLGGEFHPTSEGRDYSDVYAQYG